MPLHSVDGVTYHNQQPHPYTDQYQYQSRPRHGTLRVLNPSESTHSLALSPSPSHNASISDSGSVLSSPSLLSPSHSLSSSSPVHSQRRVRQDDIEDLSEKIRRRRRAFVDAVTLAIGEGRDPYTQPYRYSRERPRSRSRVQRDVEEQRQDQQRYSDVPKQTQDDDNTHAQNSSSTLPPYELSAEQGDVVVLSPEVDLQFYSPQLAVQLPQRVALPDSDPHRSRQQDRYPPSRPHPVENNSGLSYSQERHSDRDRVWPWPSHLRFAQPQPSQSQPKMHPKFAEIRPLMIQRKQHLPDVHLHRQPRLHAAEGSYDNARPCASPHPTYPHQSLRPGHAHNPRQAPPHVSVPVPMSIPMPPPSAAAPLTRHRYPERGHGQGEVVVGCRYPDPRSYHTTRRPLPTRQQPQPHIDPYRRDYQLLSQAHPPSLRPSYQSSAQHPPSSSSAYSYSYPQFQSRSHPQFSSYSSNAAPTTNSSRGASAPVVKLSVDGLSYEDNAAGGGGGPGRARGDIGIPRPREHLHLGYSRPHCDGGAGRDRDVVAAAYSGAGVAGQGQGQGQRLLVEDRHRYRQREAYPGQGQGQPQAYAYTPATPPQRREGRYSHLHSHSQPAAPSINVNPHSHRPDANVNANMISVISQQPQRHPGMQVPARSGRSAATAWNPKGMPLAADGTREWSTDLCGFCDHNLGTCCKALWCPCIIYAQNKARIEHLYEKNAPMSEEMESCNEDCVIHGLLSSFSLCLFGWVIQIQNRAFIRRRYSISGDWLGDCCAALCCCSACELAQESREIELEEGFRISCLRWYPCSNCIKAGLVISNEEGRRWFEHQYGIRLADHHRQDSNVPLRLHRLVQQGNIAVGCSFAPRRHESGVSDFLVITQMQYGRWMNDGPDNYEEVFKEELKPHPSVHEEKVREWLENELGIKTSGFKSYFA